jgi:hypothetical protein
MFRRATVIGAAIVAIVVGFTPTAQADTGWMEVYAGEGYFWSDPGGLANSEQIAACDYSPTNDIGVSVEVYDYYNHDDYYGVYDSLDNDTCVYRREGMFPEGTLVEVRVCQYDELASEFTQCKYKVDTA